MHGGASAAQSLGALWQQSSGLPEQLFGSQYSIVHSLLSSQPGRIKSHCPEYGLHAVEHPGGVVASKEQNPGTEGGPQKPGFPLHVSLVQGSPSLHILTPVEIQPCTKTQESVLSLQPIAGHGLSPNAQHPSLPQNSSPSQNALLLHAESLAQGMHVSKAPMSGAAPHQK